ncbi:MAG: antibiotic biosynthesis monooxygenase [Pseudomonadota bacterium]
MFVAMNRFRIRKGREAEFEEVWRSRESRLDGVPGFESFHLLKGPEREDHVLYASHSIWRNEAAFTDWTKSESFRAAHKNAKSSDGLYLGPPDFEGFTPVEGA